MVGLAKPVAFPLLQPAACANNQEVCSRELAAVALFTSTAPFCSQKPQLQAKEGCR